MNQLPNELILMILNKLGNLNVLFECRLVCRRWNELVKLIRIKVLQVGERLWFNNELSIFSIDSNPILFETNRTNFMELNLMKATILSRLKEVFFSHIEFTGRSLWSVFEKSLQQLR